MFDSWERFKELFGRLVNPATSRQSSRRRRLQVEALEERCCPANVWEWNGAFGMTSNWSNATGGNWLLTVPGFGPVPAAAGMYPGMAGSAGDIVQFDSAATGLANEDVFLPSALGSLEFTRWIGTLTLNSNVSVTGGDFILGTSANISLQGNNTTLQLQNLTGPNSWTSGTITGGATDSFVVYGTQLFIMSSSFEMETNMLIQGTPTQNASVTFVQATGNLTLTGASNYIEVANGGTLNLNQQVAVGQQNAQGGIAVGAGWTGAKAVQVDAGGTLNRTDPNGPLQGAIDQVSIAGAVYNQGGTVNVGVNTKLALIGQDPNGYSYWQNTAASAVLQIVGGGNINATGTYEIDFGTVNLESGGATFDDLDGAGLIFGNANPTNLNMVDIAQTPGTITVQGPVTLAANTTTTMNYIGGNNTADLLDVRNGTLTLAGTLYLNSFDGNALTAPCNFFDDVGVNANIAGAFASITGSYARAATYTGKIVQQNAQVFYYQVTMTTQMGVGVPPPP